MPAITAKAFCDKDYSAGPSQDQLPAMYESMLASRQRDKRWWVPDRRSDKGPMDDWLAQWI